MNCRKHWYEIRAWADGWRIEFLNAKEEWYFIDSPSFTEKQKYRVVPDSEGWLPWYGGECPLKPGEEAEVNFRTMKGGPTKYGDTLRWADTGARTDVVAYRIIKEADPYAELKAAAKDPTKQIRCAGLFWKDAGYNWQWDIDPNRYEIRDKPKTKKVKLLAYADIGQVGGLIWRVEHHTVSSTWKRVPSEDKEIEVEL